MTINILRFNEVVRTGLTKLKRSLEVKFANGLYAHRYERFSPSWFDSFFYRFLHATHGSKFYCHINGLKIFYVDRKDKTLLVEINKIIALLRFSSDIFLEIRTNNYINPNIYISFIADLILINWFEEQIQECNKLDISSISSYNLNENNQIRINEMTQKENTFSIKKYTNILKKPKTDLQNPSIIYFFKLLQRNDLITSDIDNKDMGKIIEILTGRSATKISQSYNDYDSFLNITDEDKIKIEKRLENMKNMLKQKKI